MAEIKRIVSLGEEAKNGLNNDGDADGRRRRASVLVPLFWKDNTLHVLFTQRSLSLRTHPGWVCFPGGKQDAEDQGNHFTTALRETREEIGLNTDCVDILCVLPTVQSQGGLIVTPVVGLIKVSQEKDIFDSLNVQPDEVERVFSLPLSFFATDQHLKSTEQVPWGPNGDETFLMKTYTCDIRDNGTDSQSPKISLDIKGLTAKIAQTISLAAQTE